MKTKLILSLYCFMALALAGQAQTTAYTFGLKEAVKYGLENSNSIRMANRDRQKAEYKTKELKSTGLPQVSAEGQFQHFPNLPTQLLPGEIVGQPGTEIPVQFGTDFNVTGSIKATQLLYSHQFLAGLKAAKSSVELYDLLKIQTEEDVIYQISKAFYQTLQLQTQIEVLDSNLAMLAKLENLMKVQYENDMVTKTHYSRVKVSKANLQTQVQSLKITLTQQTNYLKLLMGMPIENELTLIEPENLDQISLATLEDSKNTSIQLQILDKQSELNTLNKQVTTAGYYPTLALFGQQSYQAQRNEFNFFDQDQPWFQQTVWGVQLQIPLFDGLKKHHQTQQIMIDLDKLRLQRSFVDQQLDMQHENAREQLVNSLAAVKDQQANQELALEVYEQTQLMYKEEVATLTDLLDAEQAYRDAQTNYQNEILKFKQAELELIKSQGQLSSIIQ